MSFLVPLLCFAGLAGVYKRLAPEFPRGVTFIALALLAGATPLAWYTFVEPSVADLAPFAAVAWLVALAHWRGESRVSRSIRILAWVGLAAVPLAIGLQTASSMRTGSPVAFVTARWIDVLFSSRHGLFWWTPIAYIAAAGTIAYTRRDWRSALGSMLVVIATAYAIGATAGLDVGPAFGARRMLSVVAVLAPGLALVLETLRRRPGLALAPLVAAPIAWNYLLMVQYTVGMLPKDEPVSFARVVRQQADAHLAGSHFYPFAFPANVLFAWREGLPVDRYDLLGTAPILPPAVTFEFARGLDPFLLEGWDAPGTDAGEPVWWTGGRTATVAVPFTPPESGDVRVTVKARTRHEEPAVEADLGVQVNGHDVGQFSAASTTPTEVEFIVPAGVWRKGYNKISFVSRGVHRVDPADTRLPGPIGRRTGTPPWPVAIYKIGIRPGGQ